MSREVLYRKWRPRTFAELAGQELIARTLTNAIGAGGVSHAYLFSGPRGTGKTTTGRLLAKAVNCTSPKDGEPCNACDSCEAYLSNAAEKQAFQFIELDAASNRGIDEIRSLRDKATYGGGNDSYKVYLIDEVHMLTEPAFNALLKTLEEPPPHVIFVLATTEAHKVPPTVASRCQRFDFRRIPLAAAVDRLAYICKEEGISCPQDALEAIARTATGSMRDSINLLEQLVDSSGKKLTMEHVREGLGLVVDPRSAGLATAALRNDLAEGLLLIASVRDDGLDLRQFQRQVVAYLRALLLTKAGAPPPDSFSVEQLEGMKAVVADASPESIVSALHAFGEADLRADPLSPLPLELALATCVIGAGPRAPQSEGAVASTGPAQAPVAGRPVANAPVANPRPAPVGKPPAKPANEASEPLPKERRTPSAPKAPEPPVAPVNGHDADASPEVVELRTRWPEIYQRARELHYRVGALLNSGCGIIQASEEEIVFGFKHTMHLDRMLADGGENFRALQQAVDEVLGPGRTVRCVLAPDVDVQRPASRGGHLVRAAEEIMSEG